MKLTEAIERVTKKKGQLNELAVGGGTTGPSVVSSPTGVRAQPPGQSRVQGDLTPNTLEDGVTGVEETDPENNTKPTGDMSALNVSTIAAKGASMKEHVEAMFNGEDLSEEFKERAEALFEAAVIQRVELVAEDLEEQFNTALEEKIEALEEESQQNIVELVNKLDDYLNHVVETWLQENQIALEHSLRTEVTEEFIEGLRTLFTENYINVPEDKFDVVEELAAKVEALEAQLNETVHQNIELTNALSEMTCQDVVEEICEGLTVMQADKLKRLSEGVEFDDIENFKKKITIIKENYFPSNTVQRPSQQYLEESFDGEEEVPAKGQMAKYVTAISKTTTTR